MSRNWKILIGMLTAIAGWIMLGLGFATLPGPVLNTTAFLLGLVFIPTGITMAITWGKK